jgi:hypothetical protein
MFIFCYQPGIGYQADEHPCPQQRAMGCAYIATVFLRGHRQVGRNDQTVICCVSTLLEVTPLNAVSYSGAFTVGSTHLHRRYIRSQLDAKLDWPNQLRRPHSLAPNVPSTILGINTMGSKSVPSPYRVSYARPLNFIKPLAPIPAVHRTLTTIHRHSLSGRMPNHKRDRAPITAPALLALEPVGLIASFFFPRRIPGC